MHCDTTATECTKCNPWSTDTLALDSSAKDCVADCPATFWEDHGDNDNPVCTPCGAPCLECSDAATNCTKCNPSDDLFLDGETCVADCPAGTFKDSTTADNPLCTDCTSPCAECGTTGIECTKCIVGKYLKLTDNTCVDECPNEYYEDSTTDPSIP